MLSWRGLHNPNVGTGAQQFDADRHVHFEPEAFTDAIHLRWSAAHALTERIAQELSL